MLCMETDSTTNEDVVARFREADLPSRRGFLRRPAAAGGFIVDCEQSP